MTLMDTIIETILGAYPTPDIKRKRLVYGVSITAAILLAIIFSFIGWSF